MAALKKAALLVPFARLPGGHQQKNAARLEEISAVAVLSDEEMVKDPTKLLAKIQHLVRSPRLRADMADRLHAKSSQGAAEKLADLILEEA